MIVLGFIIRPRQILASVHGWSFRECCRADVNCFSWARADVDLFMVAADSCRGDRPGDKA